MVWTWQLCPLSTGVLPGSLSLHFLGADWFFSTTGLMLGFKNSKSSLFYDLLVLVLATKEHVSQGQTGNIKKTRKEVRGTYHKLLIRLILMHAAESFEKETQKQPPTSARLHCENADESDCSSDVNWSSCSHGNVYMNKRNHCIIQISWKVESVSYVSGRPPVSKIKYDTANLCFSDWRIRRGSHGDGRKYVMNVAAYPLKVIVSDYILFIERQGRNVALVFLSQ